MNKHSHPQNAEHCPVAQSNNDHDIIAAAMSRVRYWNYPEDGPWTVYVTLGKRTVTVYRAKGQPIQIKRAGEAA